MNEQVRKYCFEKNTILDFFQIDIEFYSDYNVKLFWGFPEKYKRKEFGGESYEQNGANVVYNT